MTNETSPVQASAQALSGASAAPARTSTSGAAKVFREFKWGLLTLFLLMVVVIGLVYDGGRKKETARKAPPAGETPAATATLPAQGLPPGVGDSLAAQQAAPGAPRFAFEGQPPLQEQPAPQAQSYPPGTVRPPEVATQPPAYQPQHELVGPGTQTGVTPPPGLTPATVPQSEGIRGEHLVQAGDTLEGIARKNYPGRTYTAIKAIAEANGIADPRLLRAGTTLKLPRLPELQATPGPGVSSTQPQTAEPLTPSTPRTNTQPDEDHVYLVQAGDTLERIARKVLNDGRRWRDIYEWNRDQLRDPGVLRIGQKLKIKKNADPSMEANREQEPREGDVEQAPRRTVAEREETADETEERPARPQPAERVEPLQRWMP